MSDNEKEGEKFSTKVDPSLSTSQKTPAYSGIALNVPTDVRQSRTSSPARLSTELTLKVKTQLGRLAHLRLLFDTLPTSHEETSLEEHSMCTSQVEEIHRTFQKEHQYFEAKWPSSQLEHPYFEENCHQQEAELILQIKRQLGRLKQALTKGQAPPHIVHDANDESFRSRLPDIGLPSFSGDYDKWPHFRDLFSSIIMNCQRLSDVERLLYLRGCLSGPPAQLIGNLTITGDSLHTAWEILSTRYENRRLLIQAHLDQLMGISALTSRTAAGLNKLITTVSEANKALETLGVTADMWDCILVHHVSKNLDRMTREQWETSLGSSVDYPRFAQFEAFITSRARALERIESTSATQNSAPRSQQQKTPPKKSATAHQASTQPDQTTTSSQQKPPLAAPYSCDSCKGNHFIVSCPSFREKTPSDRKRLAVDKRLCFNCLGRHNVRSCRSTQGCKHCQARHHTMLHEAAPTTHNQQSTQPQPVIAQPGTSTSSSPTSHKTLLATAIALIKTETGTHRARLLIDPGSELTFVSEQLTKQLNITRQHSTISIVGIGGSKATHTRGSSSITLQSIHTDEEVNVLSHVLKTVTSVLPSFEARPQTWPHIHGLKLADPDFLEPRQIDLIIGADSYGQIIKPNIIKGLSTMPIAQLSIFGWLILGPVDTVHPKSSLFHHVQVHSQESALTELLTKFWVQEETPAAKENALTPEDQECETHFRTTHSRDASGRYVVRIPLKAPLRTLGNSYNTAHHCLQRTIKRLSNDSEYKRLYIEFLSEYERLGHMARAPSSSSQSGETHYYLPHHGVLRPDSETTKLRVVFNGSSPTSSGISANDLMHTGPNLLLNITDVLIWIREFRHIFSTDITKMYRQIKVHPDDWNLQRILWIDDNNKEVPYHLTTVTYGTKAAPYLACRALLQLGEDEGHRFPLAMPSLTHGRYVDDIFGGADTTDQLINIANQLKQLCAAGGFPLAKWHTTDSELLRSLSITDSTSTTISLDDCTSKILGLKWNSHEDKFMFSTKLSSPSRKLTKRIILSEVAQIFDPLGFLTPVIIRAKMLLQELWLCKLNWDDTLPLEISSRWLIIREDLASLAKLSIPRWFNTWSDSSVEIHGFSDASKLAMSAVIYILVHSPSTGTTSSSFVCSRTKVAPLKPLTINKLELTAALLLAQLASYVQATLTVNVRATHLWTDSTCTLTWIRAHPSRWKDYVRNRVTKIQELTQDCQWRHVPGTSNPADCASRGITTARLQEHSLWWAGPPWLTLSANAWPTQTEETDRNSLLEARPGISLVVATHQPEYHWDLIARCHSLHKLFRLTALCFRICSRMRKEPSTHPTAFVPAEDYNRARIFWIKATQAAYFSTELKVMLKNERLSPNHAFNRLTAFIDEHGVIRVGGRLNFSSYTHEGKHPAILPRHSRLTSLIIDQAHKLTLHGGTQSTLAHTRQSYWILGGRAPVKTHILRCVTCARQRGIRAHQLMSQLPLCRVTPSRPFTHTGVDYAGPVTLKTWKGRGAKTFKGWICVLVCFSTSAVHLEAVSDYSAAGFISAYRRFSSRRGIAHTIYSDCGTNFIGADRELRQLFTQGSQENLNIASLLSRDNTDWRFNPPAAPHMGGKWEAVVKSTKFHLRRTVGEALLTFEELTTLLTQIEAILNSRPLEPLSDDPADVSALTPGHFLIGSALTTLPEPSLKDLAVARLSRWQFIQQRIQQFWTQWSAHYLQRLQAISKWHHPTHNIRVGSLVLLTDERLPPCKWPMARVIELHLGADGLTRIVSLKTSTSTLKRPITKLTILPVAEQDQLNEDPQPN